MALWASCREERQRPAKSREYWIAGCGKKEAQGLSRGLALGRSSWLGDMPSSLGLPFLETTQVAGCDIATAQWRSGWGWAGVSGQTVMEDV